MPKNSRRKKQTRQHATRKGEHYIRARRATDVHRQPSVPPDSAGLAVLDAKDASTDEGRVLPVQRMLESRGWVALPYANPILSVNALGVATSINDMWEFPAAFGGAELEDEEGVAPQKPTLGFGTGIWIDTAGNWGGCEQHRSTKLELPWTQRGLAQLPELLGEIEEASTALDPHPYIECLENGPCAELA